MDQFIVRTARPKMPTEDESASTRAQAKEIAANLGLTFHKGNKVGRPSRQSVWEELILTALRKGKLAIVSELQTKIVPA
eukprot:2943547-Amphidinium_carterae.1